MFRHFLTPTKKKTFWRIFRLLRPMCCLFLPRVHLEKQQLKHGETCKVLFMTEDFQTHFSFNAYIFVNKHCCPFKCFIELYYFLVLIVCQDLILIAFPVVVFSHHTEHRMQENSKCRVYQINMEFNGKMYTRKWFWDLLLLVLIQTLDTSHWKFGLSLTKFRSGLADGWFRKLY